MGMVCSSCESRHEAATAKLILQDGTLQEFSCPVKASYVLHKIITPPMHYFICNADEMEFDGVVSAVNHDEELQLGHLYFALPINRLNRPLQPKEMAALAVKASSALTKGSGGSGEVCCCSRKPVSPLDWYQQKKVVVAAGGGIGRRKSKALLTAIPE